MNQVSWEDSARFSSKSFPKHKTNHPGKSNSPWTGALFIKIMLKRLCPLFLLYLITSNVQAQSASFFYTEPSHGPECATSFSVQFLGMTNNTVGGPYRHDGGLSRNHSHIVAHAHCEYE